MNNNNVISTLLKEILVKGVPIEKSEMFKTLSDMNVSDQYISDYSNGLHNLLKIRGAEEAIEKVLTIFRINPLVAVRIIESCSLVDDIDVLAYSIKPLFYAVQKHGIIDSQLVLLNKNKGPYLTLLIEAVFQRSIGESDLWDPAIFIKYAQEEDVKLHDKGKRAKYLNAYNIRHILTHIPEERQIEFINWFWDQHCYAAKKYGKVESFSGSRVKVMMGQLSEGSIWQHLENVDESKLSSREIERVEKERAEIIKFIDAVFQEGRHMQYVKIILGKDSFYEKLKALMGDSYVESYNLKVDEQKKLEEQDILKQKEKEEAEKAEEEYRKRHEQYNTLVWRVKQKYKAGKENLLWHDLEDDKNPQINLWTYWQGYNFENVKLMILGFDWGSVKDTNKEMEKCLRTIKLLMKNNHVTKYYSCQYKKTDYNLAVLFRKCFNRELRRAHYKDLFFSNICLGYRKESNSFINDDMVFSDIADFMSDELSIIDPKSIFCLGEKVYRLFVSCMDPAGGDKFIERGTSVRVTFRDIRNGDKTIRAYSMPHCGVAGTKILPLDQQIKYWELVKSDLNNMGIYM